MNWHRPEGLIRENWREQDVEDEYEKTIEGNISKKKKQKKWNKEMKTRKLEIKTSLQSGYSYYLSIRGRV